MVLTLSSGRLLFADISKLLVTHSPDYRRKLKNLKKT